MAGARTSSTRFYVDSVLACLSGVLGVITLFWRDWIEVFGFDPDHGSGLAEWVIVLGLLTAAVLLAEAARAHRPLAVQQPG